MQISLTPELDQLVQQRIATGAYRSQEEVLQAALLALEAEEQTLAAIMEGHADYEQGRYRPVEEADASFRELNGLPRRT
jgi:putative addiction module CopG family antidote